MLAYGHDAQLIDKFVSTLKEHPQHTPLNYSPTDVNDWLEASRVFASSFIENQRTLLDEINTLLSAQHIASGEDYRQRVFKKMHYSPEVDKQRSMAAALAWTTQSRLELDAMEAEQMENLSSAFADDMLLTTMLGNLTSDVLTNG
jgi:hypothetical protein